MKTGFFGFAVGVALLAAGSSAAAPPQLKSVCAPLLAAMSKTGALGATAAVGQSDGSVVEFALGSAAGSGAPIEPGARFLSGSIGKTFVAALALDLHTRGVLDLDEPLQKVLGTESWFNALPNASVVTMRQLLTHSSGWPTHVSAPAFQRAISTRIQQCPTCPFTALESIHFVEGMPPLFAPGQGFSYSETNYLVAGLAIEKVSRRSYYDLLQERILTPLQLRDTVPSDRNAIDGLVAGRITPRTNYFGLDSASTMKGGVLLYNPGLEWTGGGLAASSADLVRWAQALYAGRALPLPYLHELFASVPAGGAHERYGLGVGIEGVGARTSYGHTGSIPGYRSVMRYFPNSTIAVAVQVNDDLEEDSGADVVFVEAALESVRLRTALHSATLSSIRCSRS